MNRMKRIAVGILPMCAALLIGINWHDSAQAKSTYSADELEQFRQLNNHLLDSIIRQDSVAVSAAIADFRVFIREYPRSIQRRGAYLSLLDAHRFINGDCKTVAGLVDTLLAEYNSHSELHLAALALASSTCEPKRSADFSQRAITALADTSNAYMPRYLLTLGLSQIRQGQKSAAIATLERALTLDERRMAKTESIHGSYARELKRVLAEIQTTE